ncbi:MAG TPA: mercuric reductase [Candidatus Limnocylindrales bacterium]|nr:mercuric reductase [Candidatus Limnocylindrales bacterium]
MSTPGAGRTAGDGLRAEPMQHGSAAGFERSAVEPLDEHNRTLLANVAPATWRNPAPARRYNLVVLGAGSGGLISAAVAAGLGARVALVERNLMGGDCLNFGCVPSKTLIRCARRVAEAQALLGSQPLDHERLDEEFARAMARVRAARAEISADDSAHRYRDEMGIDVFIGSARFTSADAIDVGGATLRFRKAIVASGARAAVPPVPGLAEAGFLTNETIFNLTQRPRRLAVIGGGPIGCELAQAMARLGCQVTVLDVAARLLPREDADAADIVARRLVRDGVSLALGVEISGVTRSAGGRTVRYTSARGAGEVVVDEILVATGRAPNVEGLGLEAAGVRFGKRGIEVDDNLRTTNAAVFAVGDCCLQWQFTHAADAAAKIAVQNALFFGRKKMSGLAMPWCTFTDPEVAHVGLYEDEARERGIALDTFTIPLSKVNRAVCDGETDGFVRIHTKKGTPDILGATIVASHAGEMISQVTLAMAGKLSLATIAGVIHPYPTQAEGIKAAANSYMRTRLTPLAKAVLGGILRLTR